MAKTAIITGASRGIGRAIATTFASHGYDLILTCSKSMETLKDLEKILVQTYGVQCSSVSCDGGNPQQVDKLFELIKTKHSNIDVLVNNAGISYFGLLQDMSIEDWNHIMQTNLSSAFYFSRNVIPIMLTKHQGKIINISSVWGIHGASYEVAYSASKGGINSLTKALAKELAPSNIQVNAIACGVIDTAMNHCISPEDTQCLKNEIPSNRFGTPEEVAHLTMQLCTSNNYLTGQIISLDGGWC
ncbi:elongation factor P 5-aminopentanone reductase [Anaerosacchariphilus polymeriproducens]|uniref:SDR family NAD(P)-dependent oxidoreductase n=1 Tax=Anaerosacchariphilus polymeriproducens TaxID=1812858 RepID=A0A371AVQ2_9FIRM|nr:SDR family NAD(P)-dependent oxidoreductase [Anaerosacchariphilus polymeriproducens]RDU23609.1 SDR family NAD(P)-dependent oxidoreductase [Anaerosacchariphilus polymeriproducens]